MKSKTAIRIVMMAIFVIAIDAGFTLATYFERRDTVKIVRANSAVEVWHDGKLLHEFTQRNCDSASLETLNYIIKTAEEQR